MFYLGQTNLKMMRYILAFVLFVGCLGAGFSQGEVTGVVTYDVVYLTGGGILRGEIKALDEQTGGISFVDVNGRHYFLVAGDYEYFVEDKVFDVKKKGPKVIHPRKSGEIMKSIGFVANDLERNHSLNSDGTYHNAPTGYPDWGLGVEMSVGKFDEEESYLGGFVGFGLIGDSDVYLSVGGEYQFGFSKPDANHGGYIPIQLYYNLNQFDMEYDVIDISMGWQWENVEITHQSLGFAIGYGTRFFRADKKSVVLELMMFNHMQLSEKFEHTLDSDPQSDFELFGGKFIVGLEF